MKRLRDYPYDWRPVLDPKDGPLYLQIRRCVERDVAAGVLRPGQVLPPQRDIAAFLGVNLSTVTRAMRLCTQSGVVVATVGSRTRIAYDALTTLGANTAQSRRPRTPSQASSDGESAAPVPDTHAATNAKTTPDWPVLADMGACRPDSSGYEEVLRVAREMLDEPGAVRLFSSNGAGTWTPGSADAGREGFAIWQREEAARWLETQGCHGEASRVLVANGAQNALTATLASQFSPQDRIGCDQLTYPGLKSVARMLDLRLVPIPPDPATGSIDLRALERAAGSERLRGLYVMPDLQNPTAMEMGSATREGIADLARKHDLLVIEDGLHPTAPSCGEQVASQMRTPGAVSIADLAPDHTIFVASLSVVSPGLRLAYLSVPERLLTPLSEALRGMNLAVSPFLLELASRLEASGALARLSAHQARVAQARGQIVDRLLGNLPGLVVTGGAGSPLRWVELTGAGSVGPDLEALAREAGVEVYGAMRFTVGAAAPRPALRLAITTETQDGFERGMRALRRLFERIVT